jgi:hypothetical protein
VNGEVRIMSTPRLEDAARQLVPRLRAVPQ